MLFYLSIVPETINRIYRGLLISHHSLTYSELYGALFSRHVLFCFSIARNYVSRESVRAGL